MKLKDLPKLFTPSNSKLDIDQRFHRIGEWTVGGVNCSWMIKSFYEPTGMASLKDKPTTLTVETVDGAVNGAIAGTEKLAFDEKQIYLTDNLPVACLLADNAYIKVFVNAYYLCFFLKAKTKDEITFWGKTPDKMVIVRAGNNVIGAFASINMERAILPEK